MKKIGTDGFVPVGTEECERVYQMMGRHDENLHYLAFDRQLSGYAPIDGFVPEELKKRSDEIIGQLTEKQEVCSLYPQLNLTLYPIVPDDSLNGYSVVTENADKHFADIRQLNDEVYKTNYIYVDLGNGAGNMDVDWLYRHLAELKKYSWCVLEIYAEGIGL